MRKNETANSVVAQHIQTYAKDATLGMNRGAVAVAVLQYCATATPKWYETDAQALIDTLHAYNPNSKKQIDASDAFIFRLSAARVFVQTLSVHLTPQDVQEYSACLQMAYRTDVELRKHYTDGSKVLPKFVLKFGNLQALALCYWILYGHPLLPGTQSIVHFTGEDVASPINTLMKTLTKLEQLPDRETMRQLFQKNDFKNNGETRVLLLSKDSGSLGVNVLILVAFQPTSFKARNQWDAQRATDSAAHLLVLCT
jgi:hypothetical protein